MRNASRCSTENLLGQLVRSQEDIGKQLPELLQVADVMLANWRFRVRVFRLQLVDDILPAEFHRCFTVDCRVVHEVALLGIGDAGVVHRCTMVSLNSSTVGVRRAHLSGKLPPSACKLMVDLRSHNR